jgi:uncharacterized membrane protein YdbT with pleckstrin-like domain
MKYRQTIVAYIAQYVLWKWIIAIFIYPAIYDYYRYKRHILTLGEKSIELQFGVFTQNQRQVPYKNIQSVNVHQSVLGQMFNYGDLLITTANQNDAIVFKFVDSPQMARPAGSVRVWNRLSTKFTSSSAMAVL